MIKMRELEKFEISVLNLCKDDKLREKLRNKMLKSKQPTDPFQLKKIENKIEKANKKIS
ncbi:MAG: hypothetical protein M1323_03190 [Candidatus Thermoplasmatota archaeon]|jgi:hypothetical protein|uniref:Uncharacterized protein n=2 Tax=Thermoplasmata TaxID=183967 RepID=A0A1N5U4C6_9ARCH|nr:hypothetical protein [Candidatus Thermoplasmatota archaeon]SIM55108.1 hypothetical protein CSP5_0788 [Cuniculiplasma divulgatum]